MSPIVALAAKDTTHTGNAGKYPATFSAPVAAIEPKSAGLRSAKTERENNWRYLP
jgi:hypothetical protein